MNLAGPPLSFAIPYYADRSFLSEAIASVRAQTMTEWELVVVDDCGPEPAQDLVAALGDDRIRYVRNETNLGLARNWNECVRLARAPWVTVLHADDRLRPDYGSRVLAAAGGRTDVAAVFTDATVIDATGAPTHTVADRVKDVLPRPTTDHDLSGDKALAGLLRGNYIHCPSLCLAVSIVGTHPFDPRWRFVPDWAFTCGVLLDGGILRAVRTPLLDYRRHPASQTSQLTSDSSRFVEEIAFLREMADQASARGWSASSRVARRRITVRGHLVQKLLGDLVGRRFAAARLKGRLLAEDLRRGT